MISLVRESERKECQLITPFPSHNFTYQSPWLWNKFESVNRSINFSLTTIKIKNILKYSLLEAQNTYGDNWCEYNFTKFAKIDKDYITNYVLVNIHSQDSVYLRNSNFVNLDKIHDIIILNYGDNC